MKLSAGVPSLTKRPGLLFKLLLIVLTSLLASPFGLTEETTSSLLSLPEAFSLAEAHNPSLLAARSGIAISEADIRIAGEVPNPELTSFFGFGRTTYALGNGQQIGINQTIETAGKRKKRVQLAKAQQALTAGQINMLRWAIRDQVRQTYTELAVAEARSKLLDAQADLLQQMVDIARKRFEVGATPEAELLQAQLTRDRLDTQKTEVSGHISETRIQLNALLGNQLAPDFRIDNHLLDIPLLRSELIPGAAQELPALDKLIVLGYSNRPDLKTAQLQKQVAHSQITLERAKRIPDLEISSGGQFLNMQAKYSPTGQKDFFGGGYSTVTMEVPVFHNQQAEIARAEAQMDQVSQQIAEVRNRIRSEIQTAYELLQTSLENIRRYQRKLMPASEEVLQLAQASYFYGKTGLSNVILAQQADQEIRQGYLNAIADYQRTWGSLEKAIGGAITP